MCSHMQWSLWQEVDTSSSILLHLTFLRQGLLKSLGFLVAKLAMEFVNLLFSKHLVSLHTVSVWVLVISILLTEPSPSPSFFKYIVI